MTTITELSVKDYLKEGIPDIRPGDTIRVHQRIKEGEKERIQIFEGVVLAKKHGKGISG
ncbi:MAG TPA: 50S ribosomal protein L19, partial [Candidatus Paceibacterota bacterium]